MAGELRKHASERLESALRGIAWEYGNETMKRIDLNCDMGESYGAWTMGADAEVMPHITSANIACGFHGGDPATIRKTVRLALDTAWRSARILSLPDIQGFGRRAMKISPQDMYDLVVYQAGAVEAFARAAGSQAASRQVPRRAVQHGGDGRSACPTRWRAPRRIWAT